MNTNKKGYTLIELIVTLAIMSFCLGGLALLITVLRFIWNHS